MNINFFIYPFWMNANVFIILLKYSCVSLYYARLPNFLYIYIEFISKFIRNLDLTNLVLYYYN